MISPVLLEDLAKSHSGHLKVVKVDVHANPGLAGRFGAQSIPLLVVIGDGQKIDRLSARYLALRWSSGCGHCWPSECRSGLDLPRTGVSPGGEMLEPRVKQVRDLMQGCRTVALTRPATSECS